MKNLKLIIFTALLLLSVNKSSAQLLRIVNTDNPNETNQNWNVTGQNPVVIQTTGTAEIPVKVIENYLNKCESVVIKHDGNVLFDGILRTNASSEVSLEFIIGLKGNVEATNIAAIASKTAKLNIHILTEGSLDIPSTFYMHTMGGDIRLQAYQHTGRMKKDILSSIHIKGKLNASGPQKGGKIILESDAIYLHESAQVLAQGPQSGGKILIGGDWQGGALAEMKEAEDIYEAMAVTVEKGAVINASATINGDGGKVVVWSNINHPRSNTFVQGDLLAMGGKISGKGGKIETSGGAIDFEKIKVSTLAADGSAGEWLIDPWNFYFNSSQLTTLATNLGSTDITISTANSSASGSPTTIFGTGHIVFDANLSYTNGNARTLTLTSSSDIWIKGNISSSSGALSLTFNAPSGKRILVNGDINTNGGAITVNNGTPIHFQKTSGTQAINSNGGAINFGNSNINLLRHSNTLSINSGSGYFGLGGSGTVAQVNTFFDISANSIMSWGGRHAGGFKDYTAVTLTAGREYRAVVYYWPNWVNGNTGTFGIKTGSTYNDYFSAKKNTTSNTLYDITTPNGNTIHNITTSNNSVIAEISFVAAHTGTPFTRAQSTGSEIELAHIWETSFPTTTYSSGSRSLELISTTGQLHCGTKNFTGLNNLTFNTNNDWGFTDGIISGTTNVIKSGSGRVRFSGETNYTGTTTVNAGTFRFAPTYASSKSLTGNFTNNGTVNYETGNTNNGPTIFLDGTISGTGTWNITSDVAPANIDNNRFSLRGPTNTSGQINITAHGNLQLEGSNINITSPIFLNGTNTRMRFYAVANATITTGQITGTGTVDFANGGGGKNLTLAINTGSNNHQFDGIFANSGVSSGPTVLNISKSGSGTYTLTGNNTYTGTTTISTGNLQIGNNGTSGNVGTGDIVNNATFSINRSNDLTITNLISGTSGKLVKQGNGKLTLTANNTFSGGTEVVGGTLSIGGPGNICGFCSVAGNSITINNAVLEITYDGGATTSFSGDIDFNLIGNATIATTGSSSNSRTFIGGKVTGTGNLIKTGNATLVLVKENDYVGTTISGGTLRLSNNGSLGTGNVTNNANLLALRDNDFTIPNTISGTGQIEKYGTGILTLTGNNTYSGTTTIGNGTLQLGNNGTSGSVGSGNIVNNATFTINRSDNVNIANIISGSGTVNKLNNTTATFTANNTYTGTTNITGTLVLRNNAPTSNSTTYQGTGQFRIEPASTSFSSAFSTNGWSLASTLTEFKVGKEGNTADITIADAITIAGPIEVYGGTININENINTTAGGTNGSILIKASTNIIQATSKLITTNGANVTFWADSDDNSDGFITLDNGTSSSVLTRISTSGGNITFGGGSNPSSDAAWGGFGINLLNHTELNAGSGNISLRGNSNRLANFGIGVRLFQSTKVIGANVTIIGVGSVNTGSNDRNWGVSVEAGASIQSSGSLSITGTGGGSNTSGGGGRNHGIYIVDASSIICTGTGVMTLNGTGGGSANSGGENFGIELRNGPTIRTEQGTLNIIGTTGLQSGSGGLLLTADDGNTNTIGNNSTQTGNILFRVGSYSAFTGTNSTGVNQILGTGTLTIEPLQGVNSFVSATNTIGLTFGNSLTGLTIGKTSNTANITLANATTIAGPVNVYGGTINVSENLTTSVANATILLKGTGDINLAASKQITTSNAPVILWANSDGETTNGMVDFDLDASISTNGGHIWIGGGSGTNTWNGLSVGNGYAVTGKTVITPVAGTATWIAGVSFKRNVLNSSGGDIAIYGLSDQSNGIGICTHRNVSFLAGNGKISLEGHNARSDSRNGFLWGMHSGNIGTETSFVTISSSSNTTNGYAIYLNASHGNGSRPAAGIGVVKLNATGSGPVFIKGVNSGSNGIGLDLGSAEILASSAPIFIETEDSRLTGGTASLGFKTGTSITNSSSNITIISNDVSNISSLNNNTTGTLTIRPQDNASFTATLNTTGFTYSSNISGLTLGAPSNTSTITFGSTTTIAGPIAAYGGTLAINENLTSSNGSTISLYGNALSFGSGKTVTSTGQLIVAPQNPTNTIDIAGTSGTLQLPASYFSTNFTDGFSNIQIGSNAQTGAITSNAFTLRDNMTFLTTGSLTLGGKPIVGNNNVTLGSGITTIHVGSPANYFQTNGNGVVNRTIANNTNLLFPIGNAVYNPVSIANNTGSSDVFTAKVRDAVLEEGTTGITMRAPHVEVTWDINKTNTNASSGVNFTVQWESSQEKNSINTYRLNHYNSVATPNLWEFAAGTSGSVSVSGTTKTMTHTGYTGTFSPFAIGSDATPLPVELSHFSTACENNNVELSWTTSQELNNDYFTIKESADGKYWTTLSQIPSLGNAFHMQSYTWEIASANRAMFFELSQTDIDGQEKVLAKRMINCNSNTTQGFNLQVYPNPNNGSFTIALNQKSQVAFEVLDVLGQTITSGSINGQTTVQNLAKGLYFVKVNFNGQTWTEKIIVH